MPQTTNATKLHLAIGEIRYDFLLYMTTAPARYDGFGTMTIYDCGGLGTGKVERFVVINEKHLDWQIGRYASGLYCSEPCNLIDANDLAQRFWNAITEKFMGDES
jgi:hypothetical protein